MKTSLSFVASILVALAVGAPLSSAQVTDVYRDSNMDFGSIQKVAVVPFANLARDQVVPERVRDVFVNRLLAADGVYVLPVGEVARGIDKIQPANPSSPTAEETVKIGAFLKTDAVITGVVREYGEVRSGSTTANIISMSIQVVEAGTGKVVWSASVTKGGISFMARLFGGGGQPMNRVTEKAVDALLDQLLGAPKKAKK
jgi:polysaccharide biosynthesis protein PelC